MRRARLAALWLGMLIASAPPATSQQAEHQSAAPAQPVQGVEPIRCWRQATSGAVMIGEAFRVVLTCAIVESADAQVVPDESRLNVAAIQMAPFEIIGGTHPPDVRRGLRRFFQYEYEVRIINRDAIGTDVSVPPLTIAYRIHSRVGAAAKLEGRDLSYVLPALPIRVLSLVPKDATDIRDGSEASLAGIDALRSRARMFEVIAMAFGALAAVMAVFALIPVARRAGGLGTGARAAVPERAILTSAAMSLREIQSSAAHEGWNDGTLAAALTAMRVIAAVSINRPVSRKPLPPDGVAPEGKLRVDHGLVRRQAVMVSSGVTAVDLANADPAGLRDGLTLLTSAMYRQSPERDAVAIDDAVRQAAELGDRLAAERGWLKLRWARR